MKGQRLPWMCKHLGRKPMTLPANSSRLNDAVELLINHGFDEMGKSLRILLDTVILIERERYLGAGHYERTEERQGHANGFKPKTVKTEQVL